MHIYSRTSEYCKKTPVPSSTGFHHSFDDTSTLVPIKKILCKILLRLLDKNSFDIVKSYLRLTKFCVDKIIGQDLMRFFCWVKLELEILLYWNHPDRPPSHKKGKLAKLSIKNSRVDLLVA